MGRTDSNNRFKKKNFYQMKDGDIVLRILPPLKELASLTNLGPLANKGIWSKFHSVHFGYRNMEGKLRTFESTATKVDKVLENGKKVKELVPGSDAALDRINDLKAKLEAAKTAGNAPLAAKLNALVGMKGNYNVDNNQHMNVVDLQGNIGILKIRHKAKLALDAEIKKLEGEGVDPLSVNDGRFFVFNRTGTSNETNYKISVYTEKLDIPGVGKVDKPVVHKLTADILSRIPTEAGDLDEVAPKLTAEEVAAIVATSDLLTGKSSKCDEYFDARWKAKRDAASGSNDNDNDTPDDVDQDNSTARSSITAATQAAAAVQQQASAAAPAQTAPAAANPTAAAAQTGAANPAAAATQSAAANPAAAKAEGHYPGTVEELSDDDFFAQIGVKTG